ncbi:MAG: hypothetical protein NZ802_05640, partial [Candidatus Poseidoniales archaeon]|nr:hypothetical protein [Candidatus Poseidoniales archaeon]
DIEDWDDDGYLDHSSGSNTDAFPTDNTQNSDTDGDGHGDNANGNSGDQFYTQPTQWQDADGDGYGDNQAPGAFEPDRCPSTNGTSTTDRFGCTDTDGDGFSDSTPGYFAHPQGQADSHPNNVSQYRDKDGDGYGDNPTGVYPDSCDNNHGTSTRRVSLSGANETWYGCPDADGDSYEDQSDPCKNQFGNSWVDQLACPDSDQDGISDEADPYPNTATSNTDDWDDDGVINTNDAFPADRSQTQDTDGDGFGDNSTGSNPDAFVNEISQWSDLDGDEYGDNPIGVDADDCSYTAGTSTRDRLGCPDNDGDGWSNPDSAWNSAYGADAFIDDATQWKDEDGDGYGDNVNGSEPDDCSKQAGTSTMKVVNGANITWLGCIDTDGDGYHDASDPCPFQFGNSWVDRMGCPDSDQDGISDGNDPYPEDATTSINDYDGDGVANDVDDFPADRTQSQDADGDGYGDDPNGDSPDAFPDDISQWQDSDNDGYGDNMDGEEPDECIYEAGNSTDPYGCIDTDGDGAADDYDDFPRDPTQQLDSDGDGFGDDGDTNQTDDCPYEMGDSTLGKIGCPDSDGDGWSDDDDECPDQYGNSGEPFTGCLDRDGDNVADIVDIFPDDSNESTDFDGDGIGDASDIYPFDFDNDNVTTELDWDDNDPNEQVDTDNDGVGDNADVWPMQSEIWSDVDGDGWADQFGHLLTDDCPSIPGTSTKFMHGCSDIDFDG